MFFRGSRYEFIAEAEIAGDDGTTIRYKRMRFVPTAEASLGEVVRQGDRPDLLAYRALGDPEQFWRLADVNRTQRPAALTAVPGARVAVPGPGEGR